MNPRISQFKANGRAWLAVDGWARLWAFGVFVTALTLLLSALPSAGLTDDDDFYAPAGIQYAGWLGQAVTSPSTAFDQKRIDKAFKFNREHPPIAKFVIGIAHAVTTKIGLFRDLDGARAGVAFFCALLCMLLTRLLWVPLGMRAALFAPAALLSMPRFFFHSQVATLDVPVATLVVATTAAFFWGERSRSWAWGTGIVFGLALGTKLNAPFAAIPCTLYAILCRWRGFHLDGPRLVIPPINRSLVAMAAIGPVVHLATWPWLWFDTFKRFGAYVAFHLHHYPIFLFYNGEIYNKPFAPWTASFVMAAAVLPLPILFLGVVGTAVAMRALFRILRQADPEAELPRVSLKDRLLALVLLQATFAISIVAFSNVPKYGGAKLFMPFFPLFAILAAAGLDALVTAASLWLKPKYAVPVFVFAALLPGIIGTTRFGGGFALSYYSGAVGGLRGATARGYERTYYDIADKELAHWLDANVARDGVHFEPNHKEYERTYRWMRRDGVIRRDLRLERSADRAKVFVLTHERRWRSYPALLDRFMAYRPVYEKRIDGVPLYTVYRR